MPKNLPETLKRTWEDDPWLAPYRELIRARGVRARELAARLTGGGQSLADFASGHEFFGLHRSGDGWVFREWAPNAEAMCLIGEATGWGERDGFWAEMADAEHGIWELRLPPDALAHGQLYRLRLRWPGGGGDRLPAWVRRAVQDPHTKEFNAQVWDPEPYRWKHDPPPVPAFPLIYESHVGMAQEEAKVGTYAEYAARILPRVAAGGYNTLQLMAIMEHPYYGSFGYHVSNFFAASSRFGTPEELKALIDAAHGMGLRVIIDLVHSHAVKNEVEGISRFDGTPYQYFHDGPRGEHIAWDSRCFDYAKPEVLHFLLSNCRYWLDEFRVDGFRFDGITSMLYLDHGLGVAFSEYGRYFDGNVDEDAYAYLALANRVVHEVRPDAISVAEDMSGMPGLCRSIAEGGCEFDYRLAMGLPDFWYRYAEKVRDEDWNVDEMYFELTNRRRDQRSISYVESHDQSIVGSKAFFFQLADAAIYEGMHRGAQNLPVERAIALHKLARLLTLITAGDGYLTFMGNEFGHPEWVDFPREGNGWSHEKARRRWSLRDDPDLRFGGLAEFERAMFAAAGVKAVASAEPHHAFSNPGDKVLAVRRGDALAIFNFHPDKSFTDYPIPAEPGKFRLALDSDQPEFAGQGRIAAGQEFFTQSDFAGHPNALSLYLPSCCAVVLTGGKVNQDQSSRGLALLTVPRQVFSNIR
ncbi:MAG: alpha amylase C-terminal domain-containing protein [Verrucomicrobiales bacterium]